MPTLTPVEQQRLGRIRPELLTGLLRLQSAAYEEMGVLLAIPEFGGTRTTAQQQQLADWRAESGEDYAVGKPGTSRHEYGAAFDVRIVGGGTDAQYKQLADIGERFGLLSGYYYPLRKIGKKDEFHFYLNEPLAVSIARWNAMKHPFLSTVAVAAIVALLLR